MRRFLVTLCVASLSTSICVSTNPARLWPAALEVPPVDEMTLARAELTKRLLKYYRQQNKDFGKAQRRFYEKHHWALNG